jgi:hypothetical protein
VVDNQWSIDVRRWQREGLLSAETAFTWQWRSLRNNDTTASIGVVVEPEAVMLAYACGRDAGTRRSYRLRVPIETTDCHLGGRRSWFLCPAPGCGRRVALLYLDGEFRCRRCEALAYRSQRETAHDRAARRLDKVRERLGWKPGIFNPNLGRPKGMHRTTYYRLLARHNTGAQTVLDNMERQLVSFRRTVEDLQSRIPGRR